MKSAQIYWNDRLAKNPNIIGTGDKGFNLLYNSRIYQTKLDILEWLFNKYKIDMKEASLLDIGCGMGFFVEFYVRCGAKYVCGIDISKMGIEFLQKKYPHFSFIKTDIGKDRLDFKQQFDLVTLIDVIYCIYEDDAFLVAINNCLYNLRKGGYLFINDTFNNIKVVPGRLKFRAFSYYRDIFKENNVSVLEKIPLYIFLRRRFIPVIGPFILNRLSALIYKLDRTCRLNNNFFARHFSNMYFILAKKN